MKKLLALVLALVMTLSLAVVGSNAAFKDADKVNETYAEAVDVLAGMKVFQGYTDGSFQPEGSITRAEVAAIVYRLYTGDVADKQASLYASYNKFNDMNGAAWAKGYIGYCANAGLVKGYDAKTFAPQDKVTGYQALAMILRAVGYDKNGEFVGADWQLHVAQTAQQLGVLKNVKGEDSNAAASRQLVAELLFQTAANVPMVTYTPALGYTNLTAILNGKTNATLGEKNFGLTKVEGTQDKWGRPSHKWTNGKTTVYATIQDKADATYNVATAQCDIAKTLGLDKSQTFDLYKNSGTKTGTQVINPLGTSAMVGAQGQQVEVYKDANRIVVIDTFLAKVADVKNATYDKNGHLSSEATITLNVFDQNTSKASSVTAPYILTNGETNYEYAAGDMVLVNAYTNNTTDTVTKNFYNAGTYAEIVGKAEALDGTQTVVWYNAAKHTVNGTTYADAAQFHLDEAVKQNIGTYTWYFDQFGNLIGDVEVATKYDYAVLTGIWWNGDNSTGTGKAMATLKYVDGTENTVNVATIDGKATIYADNNPAMANKTVDSVTYFTVASNKLVNDLASNGKGANQWINGHLLRVETKADGSVMLTKVLNNATPAAHAEINAPVYNRNAWIKDAAGNALRVDTTTLFLTYNPVTKEFVAYNGLNEVPTYSNAIPAVDYVMGANNVAKYVYVYGEPDSAVTKDYVLITSTTHSATLKTETNGVAVWEVNLNTVEGTVTVKTKDAAVKDKLVDAANINKLFYLTFTNGYVAAVTDVREVTTTPVNVKDNLWDSKIENAKYKDGVIEGANVYGTTHRFNVTAATVVVGELKADMTGMNVYVIYTANTAATYDAQKVYVVADPTYKPGTATYPNTVLSANVPALTAPASFGTAVKTIDIPAANWVSSTGTAIADGASMKANVQWQVYSFTEGKFVDYNQTVFQAGNLYQAVVTVYVDNTKTTTYPYILADNFAVSYNGTAQAANGFVVSFNAI